MLVLPTLKAFLSTKALGAGSFRMVQVIEVLI